MGRASALLAFLVALLVSSCGDAVEPPSEMTCAEKTSRDACEAVRQQGRDRCYWEEWASVELVDGVCQWGPATEGACRHERVPGEFCESALDCLGELGRWRVGESGSVELTSLDVCLGEVGERCSLAHDGSVLEGAPECACLCEWSGDTELDSAGFRYVWSE